MMSPPLPALRAQVLHVRMLADRDRRDGLADVDPVFDDRRPAGKRADGELVADGMSDFAVISIDLSWSMIQPLSFWPALTPSTTTTPTESFSSCTTKWIITLSCQ